MRLIKHVLLATIVTILMATLLLPFIDSDSDSDKDLLDLVVIAGQSNAEYGYGGGTCNAEALNADFSGAPQHKVMYYGGNKPANYYYQDWANWDIREAYNSNEALWNIGGYEPIIGYTLSEKSHHDVLILNTGVGAMHVAELNPYNTSGTGEYIKKLLTTALSQVDARYTINPVCWIWLQGEADKNTSLEDYTKDFKGVQKYFENYGLEDCYVVHTRNVYAGWSNIAIENIAARDKNVTITCTALTESFTETDGNLAASEPIHYSQQGRTRIASELSPQIELHNHHESDQYQGLLWVIPTLIFTAILVMTVSFIKIRRN